MLERALTFIDEHGKVIKDQSDYLEAHEHNWTILDNRKDRKSEHDLHLKIVRSFVDKVKYVENESGEDALTNKKVKTFIQKLISKIDNYIDRCSSYFELERWVNYTDSDEKHDEMDFQNEVLNSLLKRKEEVSQFKVNTDSKKTVKIDTWGEVVLPIPLRKVVENRHPEIVKYIENRRN